MSVLVINLHELDRAELLEIQPEQISDVEVFAFGGAYTCKIHMCDTVSDFESAVACETVIDTDPAEGGPFGCTGTFEVFIERGLQQNI